MSEEDFEKYMEEMSTEIWIVLYTQSRLLWSTVSMPRHMEEWILTDIHCHCKPLFFESKKQAQKYINKNDIKRAIPVNVTDKMFVKTQ